MSVLAVRIVYYSRRVGDEVPGVVDVLCIAGPHQLNSCLNFNLLKQINNKQTPLN